VTGGRLRLVRGLVVGHARRHPLDLVLALVGISIGAAVVVGVDAAVAACTGAFERSVRDLAGTSTHRIIAEGGVLTDADFVELRLARPDRPLAPVIDRRVRIIEDDDAGSRTAGGVIARLLGLDVFTAEAVDAPADVRDDLGEEAFRRFQTEPGTAIVVRPLADRLGIEAGDRIRIDAGTTRAGLEIVAVVDLPEPAASAAPDLLVTDLATAQEVLDRPGVLDRIETRLTDDADREDLESVLRAGLVLRGVDDDARRLDALIASYRLNLLALSMMASFVAVFIVYNAVLLGVERRTATIAILRCTGMRGRGLAAVFVSEAMLLGVLGGIIGTGAGWVLAFVLTDLVSGTISALYAPVSAAVPALALAAAGKALAIAVGSSAADAADHDAASDRGGPTIGAVVVGARGDGTGLLRPRGRPAAGHADVAGRRVRDRGARRPRFRAARSGGYGARIERSGAFRGPPAARPRLPSPPRGGRHPRVARRGGDRGCRDGPRHGDEHRAGHDDRLLPIRRARLARLALPLGPLPRPRPCRAARHRRSARSRSRRRGPRPPRHRLEIAKRASDCGPRPLP